MNTRARPIHIGPRPRVPGGRGGAWGGAGDTGGTDWCTGWTGGAGGGYGGDAGGVGAPDALPSPLAPVCARFVSSDMACTPSDEAGCSGTAAQSMR